MTSGLILGKFMPPHLGHKLLVDFARHYVDELTVVVETNAGELIPSELRHAWMKELFPGAEVVRLLEPKPQDPAEHPQFWEIWRDTLRAIKPQGVDYFFASESYGWKVAELLDARFVPVDMARELVPVSGTAIRQAPLESWRYLPACVKPYFLKRICVFGPESCGKTTLCRDLAARFGTSYVSEYARRHLELKGGACEPADMEAIARGQLASEEAMALQAERLLFCDTDLLTTIIWSRRLFGSVPEWLELNMRRQRYDLTFLCGADVPWENDPVRYLPDERETFFEACRSALEEEGREYIELRGSREERLARAVEEIEKRFL